MGRSPYQSEKRRKELARLKKQEEKRQRRFNKKHEGDSPEGAETGTPEGEPAPDARAEGESERAVPPDAPQGEPPQGN